MRLRLNISPCPNDTFMFDALIHGRIDTRGFEFDVRFADIEQLNRMVCEDDIDISKISYAIVPTIADRYKVLNSGSALGRGNGPLLVSRTGNLESGAKIAVPGIHTTANLLMHKLYPEFTDKTQRLFSEIAECVSNGEYDAGVLIHEGRFTYKEHGLKLVADLGLEWERISGLPLPLGAIVVNSKLPNEVQTTVSELLAESVRYAFAHPEASAEFVAEHAQEMDPEVTRSHIKLFVNHYSESLSEEGRRAACKLLDMDSEQIFVE